MRQLSSALHLATLLGPLCQHEPSLNSWNLICFHHLVLSTSFLLLVVILYVFYMPGNVQGTGAPRPWNKSALIRDKVAQNNDKGIVIEQDMIMAALQSQGREPRKSSWGRCQRKHSRWGLKGPKALAKMLGI